MKYFSLLFLLAAALLAYSQVQKNAYYYCIDDNNKTLYYSTGKATVKKGLEDKDYYQYGFMKRMGWINKSWEGLVYDIQILPASGNLGQKRADSLIMMYRSKGYSVEKVPMPYPMKPYMGYKKDGTN